MVEKKLLLENVEDPVAEKEGEEVKVGNAAPASNPPHLPSLLAGRFLKFHSQPPIIKD